MTVATVQEALDEQARFAARVLRSSKDARKVAPLGRTTDKMYEALLREKAMDRLLPAERRAAEKAARSHARLIAETTQRKAIRILRKASADGIDDVEQIAGMLKDSAFTEGRAGVIARTEDRFLRAAVSVVRAEAIGAEYVVLSDGPGCGLRRHDDPDKANGKTVKLSTYMRYPIAHPNCRRRVIRTIVPDEEQEDLELSDEATRRLARSRLRRGRA